jgi:hypothetical protein
MKLYTMQLALLRAHLDGRCLSRPENCAVPRPYGHLDAKSVYNDYSSYNPNILFSKHPQSMTFPFGEGPSFKSMHNIR